MPAFVGNFQEPHSPSDRWPLVETYLFCTKHKEKKSQFWEKVAFLPKEALFHVFQGPISCPTKLEEGTFSFLYFSKDFLFPCTMESPHVTSLI